MNIKTALRILSITAVLAIAWGLRVRAADKLPIDFDEDDYLRAGQEYAHLIRTLNWSGFLETNYRTEHPPLAKIAYGIVFSFLPEQPLVEDVAITASPAKTLPKDLLWAGRKEAAGFGTLTAFLLALVNPLAGFLLATHSFTIKYTSQIMLDGLSSLLSLGTVLAYVQYKRKHRAVWLIVSSVFLGLAADSKYLHGTVGFAILVDQIFENRENLIERKFKALLPILGWGLLSLLVFFGANPYLWPDPIGRLQESFTSVTYTVTNPNVQSANFPLWQPLVWISMSPILWHENVFLFAPDFLIGLFAIAGFARLWKRERVFALWLGLSLITLLLWKTKWPQYILILTAPLSFAAAEGISKAWESLLESIRNRRSKRQFYNNKESLQAVPWLVPGLIAFALLTLLPFLFQVAISITDFNSASIRDGFQGGIWRELFGGLSGQIEPSNPDFPFRSNKVQYTGFSGYLPVFYFVTGQGIFVFNILWMVASTSLQVILGGGLSILLNQRGVRMKKFWQAFFILPWAIPEFIGALMWLNIFIPEIGWLSLASKKYGDAFPLQFLIGWERTPTFWFFIFLVPAVWYGFPLILLAVNAGLKTIPKDIYEAASIDGANSWQTLRHMTLPLLMPVLLPAIIIRSIYAFNQFYLFQAFFFTESTLATLSYNLFNPSSGFGGGQFAVSAIINILTVMILTGLVSLFNRHMQSREEFIHA